MKITVGDEVKVDRAPHQKGERPCAVRGRIVYIHPDKQWFTLQTAHYRESFWTASICGLIRKSKEGS